mgnify:FL=1
MTSAKADFVHLHVHTTYSLLDSTLHLSDIFKKAKEYQMPAITMTDHGNLFGAIEFYQQAQKAGIKPIIGCELYVAPSSRFDKFPLGIGESSYHLIVLVKNMQGYKNLLKLSTTGYLEGFYYHPRVDKELLQLYHEGLIATSACMHGEVASYLLRGDREAAIKAALEYKDIFGEGNFYLEIMENGLPEQKIINNGVLEISRLLSIPVVATNDCHYLKADDEEAYEVLQCIQTGKTLKDYKQIYHKTNQLYLRSPTEMKSLFSYCPKAISNTVLIADNCNLSLELGCFQSSQFQLKDGCITDKDLVKIAYEELKRMLPSTDTCLSKERRNYFIRYLTDKYGIDHVAKIITFRKMRAKSAILYVGQALGIPYADVITIAKMVPADQIISLDDIFSKKSHFRDAARKSEIIEKLLSISWALKGLILHTTTKTSHMVISNMSLFDIIPLYRSHDGYPVSQYSINDLQKLGLSIFKIPHSIRQMT